SDGLARIHPCIAGIFDINGSRTPNRVGKDIQYMNSAKIKDAALATIAGYDIIKQADTPPAMDCSKYNGNAKYPEITQCPYSGETDYWVGAVVTCRDMGGHLPSMEELANIAKAVYPSAAGSISAYDSGVNVGWDTTEVAKLGIDPSSVSSFDLWSSEDYSATNGARVRIFVNGHTDAASRNNRDSSYPRFICLAES
ncbi:hypothetical protein IJ579_04410, partial [bacterium]|nr:hypothetical protein [bacterium]